MLNWNLVYGLLQVPEIIDLFTADSAISFKFVPIDILDLNRNAVMCTALAESIMASQQRDLLALLHRAGQISNERFAAALGSDQMTARQVHVLAAVDANVGASQTVLVNATGIDRSTLADIVGRLQKSGLIARRRSKTDARAYVVRLTDAGRKALSNGAPALAAVEKDLLGALTVKQRSDFLASLEKLVVASEQPIES